MALFSAGRLHRVAPLFAVLLGGCAVEPVQSMLHPAGPAAAAIARLWWIMFSGFTAVFVLVMILLLRAVWKQPARLSTTAVGDGRDAGSNPPWGRNGLIVGGGVILPILVLTPLYIFSLQTSAALQSPVEALTVRVVGHMWWWEVRYPHQGIVTANEIHIPAGKPVRLELASFDVIHSFWIPRLNGKRDMIPGMENVFWIEADKPGIYRGQCGEYCGTQHANMAFEVIALPQDEFDAWVAAREARQRPASTTERRGFKIFMTAGCVQCHAVRGVQPAGNVGPDLSHLGSRRMLGAALLPNTRDNLTAWIADPQAFKPGSKMPRTELGSDDLQALVTYLEGLK